MKFSSAVLPESFLTSGGSSGETFENFYAKTKDLDIDDSILDQLSAHEYEDKEELIDKSSNDKRPERDRATGSLSDFKHGLRNTFSCFSCEKPDCHTPHISKGCLMCYTAHVRDINGDIEKSKGCYDQPS